MRSPVFSLSIHADYRCRHSGRCCSVDWDVPVEVPIYRSLADAVRAGRLTTAEGNGDLEPFVVGPDLPDDTGAIFQRTDAGACVFFEKSSRLCIVHRDLGEPALPATCRHFPRVAVRDRRGTFVSLSHFCPTAASMLFRTDVPVAVVEAPPAFPAGDYDGLVVGDEDLPPLLTPRMLMDLDGYTAWEHHLVARCVSGRAPESIVATMTRDATVLRQWTPGHATLAEMVRALPRDAVQADPPETLTASLAMYAEVMAAVPDDLKPEPDEERLPEAYAEYVRRQWPRFSAPLNRYLAAKSFASWTAYQGRGVITMVRGIEAALALVRVEAARQCRDVRRVLDDALLLEAFRGADFALNHLAVGDALAEGWSRAEDA